MRRSRAANEWRYPRGQYRTRWCLLDDDGARRRAADNLGVGDPEAEFARWLEERRLLER